MFIPGLEKLNNICGSTYELVILAAQRAKQLQEEAKPLIRTTSTHPLTIALEEIAAGVWPPKPKDEETEGEADAALAPLLGEEGDGWKSRFDPADAEFLLEEPKSPVKANGKGSSKKETEKKEKETDKTVADPE